MFREFKDEMYLLSFSYVEHEGADCPACKFLSTNALEKRLPVAKPGVQRRIADLIDGKEYDQSMKDSESGKSASSVKDQFGGEEPAAFNIR